MTEKTELRPRCDGPESCHELRFPKPRGDDRPAGRGIYSGSNNVRCNSIPTLWTSDSQQVEVGMTRLSRPEMTVKSYDDKYVSLGGTQKTGKVM